jgi:hypothetical protein
VDVAFHVTLRVIDNLVRIFAVKAILGRFDPAGHFVNRAVVHRVTNPLKHEPRGLLRNFKSAAHFVAGDSVLTIGEHPHRAKSLVQSDGRILEDRADLNGVLFLAIPALPQ